MRLLTLDFAGLGPYRGEQRIDFTALEQDGLYLIAGRTGAGKSTILDAIVFALYGAVPRFTGGEQHLRSDHCEPGDESWVRLEFEANGERFRIRRSPEYQRPKSRGAGTTTQKAAGVLERGGPEWEGISTSLKEIGGLVPELVGLSGAEFLQVTLLAQNRFSEFLLAPNDKRQALLRRLFGTHRFDALRRRMVDRARETGRALEVERALLEQLAEQIAAAADLEPPQSLDAAWVAGVAERLAPELAAVEALWAEADAEASAAELALQSARAVEEQQRRREAAIERAAELDDAQPGIDAARAELDLARRLDAVHPLAESEGAAQRRRDEADAVALEVATAYGALPARPSPEAAADDAESLQARIGALDAAASDEERLPGTERELAAAEGAVTLADATLSELAERAAALPASIAALAGRLAAEQQLAALAPTRAERVATLTARLAAAERLTTAEGLHRAAAKTVGEASSAHRDAVLAHDALVQQRMNGFAGELASQLEPGEPCPVCGALEHPAPAAADHDGIVTAESIEAAKVEADRLRADSEAAQATERDASATVERLRAEAGETAGLDTELLAAQDEARSADAAIASAAGTESEHRLLIEQRDALDGERKEADAARQEAALRRAGLGAELQGLRERVDAARGEHASVSERRAELRDRRALALGVVTSAAELAGAASALEAARTALESELAERGLERDDLAEGRRDAGAIARLEALLREHDDARAATAAALAESSALELPEQPVDLEQPEQRMREARARRDAVAEQRSVLAQRDRQLRGLAAEALDRLGRDAERRESAERLRRLAETLDGKGPNSKRMDLEAFVLAARLEQIVEAANARLGAMTGGRYSLEHDDSVQYRNTGSGLGIRILDAFTGRRRIPSSLSGGETFLASLALALGLADVVTAESGGVRLETLFIDEGFGSLDPETLEVAMATLDGLRHGGRTVGLISHVDAMQERVPIGVRVEVGPRGDSLLRQA